MSDETKRPQVDLSNSVFPMTFDGPVYLTIESATQELVVKCFMHLGENTVAAHLRFTNAAMGQLVGGVLGLVEQGHITVTPGTPETLQ